VGESTGRVSTPILTRAAAGKPDSTAIPQWFPIAVTAGILGVYLSLPSRNYYWDGVSFALTIEQAGGLKPALVHPNHLIYNTLGYLEWALVRALGFQVRAITVLQLVNIFAAAACAAVLWRILMKLTSSTYVSTALVLLFSFSSTWWKFATDADAYILSVLFLLLATYVLLTRATPNPVLVGFLHASAMLTHELAVIFCVPAALLLFRKRGARSALAYLATAGGITLPAYLAGFWVNTGGASFREFVPWLTSHSPEVSFSFSFTKNLAGSLVSYLQLFFGGRVGLMRQFFGPFEAIVAGLFAIFFAALLMVTLRHSRELFSFTRWKFGETEEFAVTWVAAYAVFLFFWLPRNNFYKLFLLPGLILIAGQALSKYQGSRRYRLALFAAAMALANLSLSIFPYSHVEANDPLSFALRMNRFWTNKTVIYYASFSPDDWFIRYFNPETEWKAARSRADLEEGARADAESGHDVWMNTSVIEELGPLPPTHFDSGQEIVNGKHHIRYFRWNPH